ncbi:MAG: hypothetical protein ABW007_12125 [Chitinophagaceae bacterium]
MGIPTKHEILLFDEIFMYNAESFLQGDDPSAVAEMEYLLEHGVVVQMPHDIEINSPEAETLMEPFAELPEIESYLMKLKAYISGDEFENIPEEEKQKVFEEAASLIEEYERLNANLPELVIRLTCVALRQTYKKDLAALLRVEPSISFEGSVKTHVAEFLLTNLPVPDASVSWEHILEFKTDPAAHGRFLELKQWMNKAIKSGAAITEIEDEFKYLCHKYEEHMRLHKMKYRRGLLRTLITIPVEFVENFLTLKWKSAVDSLFSVKDREVELMLAELDAPGREISYILDAHEEFGKGSRLVNR